MREAATVLGIIHERGKQGLPLEDIYRQLYNPQLYLRAYDRLRTNKGAMTPGSTGETVDGMSLGKIRAIIEVVRFERYRWTPVKRVYIPKKRGRKRRPLGLPTWSDKLLGEVVRSILEAYYEPQFSDLSHGFRPRRGCHTALTTVKRTWTGTRWFIEGDIRSAFDRVDHSVLLSILGEKLHDQRFLRLIAQMLKAGYLEDWTFNTTLSGVPQGGVVSPILFNICLDRLDKFVETTLLPAYNRGEGRRKNPAYAAIQYRIDKGRAAGNVALVRTLIKQRRRLPKGDPDDPAYRRLFYVRYSDDFLLGFSGPRAEAQKIKDQLRAFLRDTLKLELSEEKTAITHASSGAARFLSYEIRNQQADDKLDRHGVRNINGRLALSVPGAIVLAYCRQYMRDGKPTHRPELLNDSDYTIVRKFQTEYRGVVQYYLLATNVHRLGQLHHAMSTSLLKTLASKHQASVNAIVRKYEAITATPHGPMKCLRVVVNREQGKPPLMAEFGGIPLRRKHTSKLTETPYHIWTPRTDLLARMLADTCELCGDRGTCQVHHVRKLADLHVKGRREKPAWMRRMSAMRRKTLAVCQACHVAIHAGRLR